MIKIILDDEIINIEDTDKKKDFISIISCLITSSTDTRTDWKSAKIEITKQ